MRILVLHPGALGDIILSLPALELLRDHFPSAEITFAANLDFSSTVCNGYADKQVSLSTLPIHRLYSSDGLTKEDVTFWKSYDRIVSWTGSGEQVFSRNLSATNPNVRIADWKPAFRYNRHVSQIFVDSLHPWVPVQTELPLPKIKLSADDQRRGEDWLGESWSVGERIVALHPGAGSPGKCWATERFQELAGEIARLVTDKLLIVEGPAELGVLRRLGDLPGAHFRRADNLALGTLAGALARCHAYVGNDSGISHLAAALDVPTVALFGPTSPEQWAPRGKHVTILYENRGCSACEGKSASAHTCLENISAQECITSLKNTLAHVCATRR